MSSTDPGAIAIYIADRDLADRAVELGATYLSVEALSGVNGGVTDRLATVEAPGRMGTIIVSQSPSAGAGTCTLTIRVTSSLLTTTESVLEAIQVWLAEGSVTIRTSLSVGREARGRATETQVTIDQPWNSTGKIVATFTLDDPYWYELVPLVLSLPASVAGVATRVTTPLGSAISNPMITVFGPSTSPITIISRDAQGNILTTLTLAASLTSLEYVTIDTSMLTIVKTSSGVVGSKAAGYALVVAPSRYPVLNPEDGDRYGQVYTTLELSDAGNTATGISTHTRAYR